MNQLVKGFSTPVIVGIGLVVLGVIGFIVFIQKSTLEDLSNSTKEKIIHEKNDTDFIGESTGTITNLISRGKNLQCDWKIPGEAENNLFGTGKIWTTDNKGRSQIAGNTAGVNMEANTIYIDNNIYMWLETAGIKQGFQFTNETLKEETESMTAEKKQQAEQISREMRFNCQPWTPDESKFQLPTDIDFQKS